MKDFFTIARRGEAELEEKRSLFFGQAAPVKTEAEALEFLGTVKARYSDANHHVFACQIGDRVQRANDGGEPAGTAGKPVLEAIKKEQVQDVAVVVTRYFGGTLLGAGGLYRAYGTVAHQAIENGRVVKMIPGREVIAEMDYHLVGKIRHHLVEEGYQIKETNFGEKVKVIFLVEADRLDHLAANLTDLSGGTVQINLGEEMHLARERE